MLIYAGVDEAGYGPMLGPLCVGAAIFRIDDHDPADGPPDLWRLLNSAVCRSRRDRRRRIAVDDSKRLKGTPGGRSHPLLHLERGVLSFLATASDMPGDDAAFFQRVLPDSPETPWYDSSSQLPVAQEAAQLQIASGRLGRAMERSGVELLGLRAEAIDAGPFNDLVARSGNKATVNMAAVVRHIDHVWRTWPNEHPRVVIDRQGGRTHYREDLRVAFPEAAIRVVSENERFSRYRLVRDESPLTLTFAKEAESQHMPVALASMLAKYTRELFMVRMNRFFQGHLPELRPTAGYVSDARRYLRDIEPVLQRLSLARPTLVRSV
ncbi:MAG: hypothetical protein ACYTF9_11105 [Planctomycetota bacterium]|jgi:ribonuclease HII